MLRDLDDSLEQLIGMGLPDVGNAISISFAPPDESFPPEGISLPALNLFLYEVRENRDMMPGSTHRALNVDGQPTRYAEPVWINCSYLITAWTSGGPRAYRDEHFLLGLVLATILRHPILPQESRRGELGSTALPIRILPVLSDRLQSMGEFWQAMGGKPKASIGLTATFPMHIDDAPLPLAAVRERIVQITPLSTTTNR